jgi:hypothetical protein
MTLRSVDVSGLKSPPQAARASAWAELPVLDYVPLSELVFDPAYQRPIERRGRANIEAIAAGFDWGRFSPLVVSRRADGTLAVIDGQHRAHAAALLGFAQVPAMIVSLSLQDEARAFAQINGQVTKLTPLQIYRAALAAREAWALGCDRAVTAAGCRMMTSNRSASEKKAGEVYAIGTVRKLVDQKAGRYLTAALTGLRESGWGEDPAFYTAQWVEALARGAQLAGAADGFVISSFLRAADLDGLEAAVLKIHKTPDYAGRSFVSLLADAVAVSIKAHVRGGVAA